nr:unnamed protein product [Callosobruchus chinensis]
MQSREGQFDSSVTGA